MTTIQTNPKETSAISLIVALGNPGKQYEKTRHNIAWQLLPYLSFYNDLSWQSKFKGEYAVYSHNASKIYFLQPQTYMNLSGESLVQLMQFFKIPLQEVLVIHDELELDFGILSFKQGGGLAGHNGLRSVASTLGSRDFKRLRLGISRPDHSDITSYVLGNFSPGEQSILPSILEESAKLLEMCLDNGFDFMAQKYKKEKLLGLTS